MKSLKYIAIFSLLIGSNAFAEDGEMKLKVVKADERKDRVIDQAAVAIQGEAIRRIEKLLKTSGSRLGYDREADLTFQLGTARLEAAAIKFRIAHEKAHRGKDKLDLSTYREEMKKAVEVLSSFLSKFPKEPRVPEVVYLRATAHDESEDKKAAIRDFKDLVTRFPEVPETDPAYMRLAEFAIDDKDHQTALKYLRPLERRVQSPHHPFALYKMAWAHFNLSNIEIALEILSRHIKYYDDRFRKLNALEPSEDAIRGNSVRDIALFYFEGVQKNMSGFSVQKAIPSFKKYAGLSPTDKMVVRFTGLLRSQNDKKSLDQWSKIVLNSDYSPETKLASLNTLIENQQNRRLYSEMKPNMQMIIGLIKANPHLEKTEAGTELKTVVDLGAKDLHKAIQENKNSPQVGKLVATLEDLYSLIRVLSVQDRTDVVKGYYNLAEAYFEIKDYHKATGFYSLAFDEQLKVEKAKPKAEHEIASHSLMMRKIASRFEDLRSSKILKEQVTPKALASEKGPRPLPANFVEWTLWIDQIRASEKLSKEERLVLRRYDWEKLKTQYYFGHRANVLTAIAANIKDVKETDDILEPQLVLWMDTLIASQSWQELNTLANKWKEDLKIGNEKLVAKIKEIEGDTFIKNVETSFKAGQSEEVLAGVKSCLKKYKEDNSRIQKCRIMEFEVLMASKKYEPLVERIEDSIGDFDDKALLAKVEDMRHDALVELMRYEDALNIELQNKSFDAKNADAVADLAFLAQSPHSYRKAIEHKAFCRSKAEVCKAFVALEAVQGKRDTFRISFDEIFKAHKPHRSLYNIAAVSNFKTSLGDRMKVMRNAFSNWSSLDQRIYWSLLPHVETWLKDEMETDRSLLSRNYPIRESNGSSIENRIARLKDFETSADFLSKTVPLTNYKQIIFLGVAGAYDDLAVEIRDVMGDEGKVFVDQLKAKAQLLTKQAAQLQVSNISVIEDEIKRLDPLGRQTGEDQFDYALKKDRWVSAKLIQANLGKAKANTTAMRQHLMDAKIFAKLGAWSEAQIKVDSAKALEAKIFIGKLDDTKGAK
ncbi:tetratricopeptide repeat protein [bacterium]|nr:tetratricopeptide repeat protein [bacterium]